MKVIEHYTILLTSIGQKKNSDDLLTIACPPSSPNTGHFELTIIFNAWLLSIIIFIEYPVNAPELHHEVGSWVLKEQHLSSLIAAFSSWVICTFGLEFIMPAWFLDGHQQLFVYIGCLVYSIHGLGALVNWSWFWACVMGLGWGGGGVVGAGVGGGGC